jgi:hypothetical protein
MRCKSEGLRAAWTMRGRSPGPCGTGDIDPGEGYRLIVETWLDGMSAGGGGTNVNTPVWNGAWLALYTAFPSKTQVPASRHTVVYSKDHSQQTWRDGF